MALRKEDAKRIDIVRYEKGGYSKQFIFDCSMCDGEISTQTGYMPFHSGKCGSCSHKGKPYQAAFRNLTDNRHKRKVAVDLTHDQFVLLCQEKDCHYCGQDLKRTLNRKEPHYRSYLLDRKDNNTGYSFENCVPCCWSCNQTKGNRYTYEEFVAISRALKEHRVSRDAPHWSAEFAWSDGDESPNPYLPLEMYSA